MSLAALLDLAVFALVGVFCGASAMQLYITERYHLSRYQFRRDCPDIPPSEPNYTLADDLNVPLIEVVLDAEARADPDYWKPKPPSEALRPPPRLPDPHRTATEHAHAILNSRMMVLGEGVTIEPLPGAEPAADITGYQFTTINGWPWKRPPPTGQIPASVLLAYYRSLCE